MSIDPGTKLGHYEIVELIGVGGMGVVYRAKDTRLGRDVALKVVSAEFAQDEERLARFQREARLLAQLNHPNVATLHGLEEVDGQTLLVMELVEGETLAERIAEGPIPVDEAIALFVQIAEGLAAAHEKGIIHRDLKPANVKIGVNGAPKILDFGLAKAFVGEQDSATDSSQSPTLTKGTALGAIMGTASYMSPEQARGKRVDKRTDIWAFGCCLYEALTGRKAFEGETVTDILAAVVGKGPFWDELPASTPANVVKVLRRSLTKDIRMRIHDIADARLELSDPGETVAPPTPLLPKTRVYLLVGAALLAGLLLGWAFRERGGSTEALTRFSLSPPSNLPLATSAASGMAVSPDGRRVVFSAGRILDQKLYIRNLDTFEATPIPGTARAAVPFFSPDGRSLAFFAGGKLERLDLERGEHVTLANVPAHSGGCWGADDTIVFASRTAPGAGALFEVSADGGEPRPLSASGDETWEYNWPQCLPGGKSILVTRRRADDIPYAADLVIVDRATGAETVVYEGAIFGRYMDSGHLLVSRDGTVLAVRFDLSNKETRGKAVVFVENVVMDPGYALAYFDVSRNGTLVYARGAQYGSSDRGALVRVDRRGAVRTLTRADHLYAYPRISPDGQTLLTVIRDSRDGDVWLFDFARETLTRLTAEADNFAPTWSPDGASFAFMSTRSGAWRVYRKSVADNEPPMALYSDGVPNSWSPDGIRLALEEDNDVVTVRADGSEEREPVASSLFFENAPAFSPDGRFLAFVSDDSGLPEVYVQAYPTGPKTTVSTEGGTEPVWSPRGDELFYRHGTEMIAVSVRSEPELVLSKPAVLFEGEFAESQSDLLIPNYDVMPSGQEFVMVAHDRSASATEIRVVVNWIEELERRLP